MDNIPNYSNYTVESLIDVYLNVDKEKRPDLFKIVKGELRKRDVDIDNIHNFNSVYYKKHEELKKYTTKKLNLKLELSNGTNLSNPTVNDIEKFIDKVGATKENSLRLSSDANSYINVCKDIIGFTIKYRDNSPNTLYKCRTRFLSKETAVDILEDYLFEDSNWKAKLDWAEFNASRFNEDAGQTNSLIQYGLLFLIAYFIFERNTLTTSTLAFLYKHNINPIYVGTLVLILIVYSYKNEYKFIKKIQAFKRVDLLLTLIFTIISLVASLLLMLGLINITV